MDDRDLVRAAVEARTFEEAETVQREIATRLENGGVFRYLGDRPNNFGLIGAGGSYDLKLIEHVTNMQDAVLQLEAQRRFGLIEEVPYLTPREAAVDLLDSTPDTAVADRVTVQLDECDPPASQTRKLTAVFRDQGCGMTPAMVPETIFHLGSDSKDKLPWVQGAFGLGGETTYRNAKSIILVTRRAPDILGLADQDRIALAVVFWESHEKGKGAYYLVDPHTRLPLSVPALRCTDFGHGTHLALIAYGVEGYHRKHLGDERSFDTVLNTRLFSPITPVRFSHYTRDRNEYLRGLERRLEVGDRPGLTQGSEVLPYNADGRTYHLPVRYYLFAKRHDAGERRKFVAYDHAVVFTSNGQVHYHWSPSAFVQKTGLKKLGERIFVVVETDELPIQFRTSLFTADRAELVRSDPAIRLEEDLAGFLKDWEELKAMNGQLVREALAGAENGGSTVGIARQISRLLKIRGFAFSTEGNTGGGRGSSGGTHHHQIDLYDDPTTLEGPEHVLAEIGKTRFVTFTLNAVDGFLPRRAELSIICTHPDINEREVTVGELRGGHVRVAIAVPVGADEGVFDLEAELSGWLRSAGGVGPTMSWMTRLEVVEELPRTSNGSGANRGRHGSGEGGEVAVLWTSPDEEEGWTKLTVGEVERVEAALLAAQRAEYAELAALGTKAIPVIKLNKAYPYLKKYVESRVLSLTDGGLEAAKGRYAVGVGVALTLLDEGIRKRQDAGDSPSESWILASQQALARGVLSMMPSFDELARETGVED